MKKNKIKLFSFLLTFLLVFGHFTQNVYCVSNEQAIKSNQILNRFRNISNNDIFIKFIYPENDLYYGCGFSIYNVKGKPIEYSFEPNEQNILAYLEYIEPIFNRNNNSLLDFEVDLIENYNDGSTYVCVKQVINNRDVYSCNIKLYFNNNNELTCIYGKIEDRFNLDNYICNPSFPDILLPNVKENNVWNCYFYNVNDNEMHYSLGINIKYTKDDGLNYSKNIFYDAFTGEYLDEEDLWVIRE